MLEIALLLNSSIGWMSCRSYSVDSTAVKFEDFWTLRVYIPNKTKATFQEMEQRHLNNIREGKRVKLRKYEANIIKACLHIPPRYFLWTWRKTSSHAISCIWLGGSGKRNHRQWWKLNNFNWSLNFAERNRDKTNMWEKTGCVRC